MQPADYSHGLARGSSQSDGRTILQIVCRLIDFVVSYPSLKEVGGFLLRPPLLDDTKGEGR